MPLLALLLLMLLVPLWSVVAALVADIVGADLREDIVAIIPDDVDTVAVTAGR
jgi:hypothetical protein